VERQRDRVDERHDEENRRQQQVRREEQVRRGALVPDLHRVPVRSFFSRSARRRVSSTECARLARIASISPASPCFSKYSADSEYARSRAVRADASTGLEYTGGVSGASAAYIVPMGRLDQYAFGCASSGRFQASLRTGMMFVSWKRFPRSALSK